MVGESLEEPGDLLSVVEGDASPRGHLVRAQAHAYGEILPYRLSHARDELEGKAHALLEVPPYASDRRFVREDMNCLARELWPN